ncbi:helix-turn-helix domain-containing protein [Amycolatopsis rubida]|uniref:Helix-turn-helix domain-containing protein n=1 Tax=Amycolatopsis rubida TaxID=112413 RepID=A0A1I5YFJ7_9PSEU|nr:MULTISPECIES: Scr1 family TA system antitoxin-like transcriptional regulator [Amycolatopsis]MYW90438.1 helix-turn-helix domain-containing protein [Amycolatopsis rubida]NEC55415.1 helix-turn-helix domain-containing protein [Amycolatopsis rubida]OAP28039.1 hypothetical protein A4R44_01649 [Amycolatopsis sp. M39]SFQ42979.1 Helix-turn-helix domain-containing protein [Amycolatopsis rubida]
MRDSKMPTPQERGLGAALRSVRIEASFDLTELSRWVGVDPALLSSWERGERVPTPEDVAGVLGALGVVGERKARIMSLARRVAGLSWFIPGSQACAMLVEREQDATSVTVWAPLLIPDLLQIPDYTRLAAGPGLRDKDILEQIVENRLDRSRNLFGAEAVGAQMFIGPEALRNYFGDPEVMLRQVRYLKKLAEFSRTVTIRVVPGQVVTEDAFSWYRQRDASEVVFCPHHLGGVFLTGQQAAPYAGTVERLAESALSPADSLGRLSAAVAGFAKEVKAQRLATDAELARLLAGEDPAD